jgi:hypothetical protein
MDQNVSANIYLIVDGDPKSLEFLMEKKK